MPGLSAHIHAAIYENARLTCRTLCLAVGLAVLADVGIALSGPATSDAEPAGQVAFDIPAQSLALALEAYSVAAGREVLYNGTLAVGRQSASVKGTFTPEVALQELLEGTGLSPRYVAADAFMLVPRVPDPKRINTAPPDVVASYYGRIQVSLKHAFCANSRTQPGDYRVAVSFWIGPSGAVSHVELLGSTGDRDLDATIDQTLRGLVVGAPPPQGFAQPVTMMVTPQSSGMTRDCQAALRPVRAGAP